MCVGCLKINLSSPHAPVHELFNLLHCGQLKIFRFKKLIDIFLGWLSIEIDQPPFLELQKFDSDKKFHEAGPIKWTHPRPYLLLNYPPLEVNQIY